MYKLKNIKMLGNEHGQLSPNCIYANLVDQEGYIVISATLEHVLCAIRDRDLKVENVQVKKEFKRGKMCSEITVIRL